jgi:ABC-type spermidine/putrescine transport system permease subunit I
VNMSMVTADPLNRNQNTSFPRGKNNLRDMATKATELLFRRAGLVLTLIVVLVFFVWPLADIIVRSFDSGGRSSYSNIDFTLDNYSYVLTDPGLRVIFGNTATVAATATLISMILAFPSAYLMSRVSRKTASKIYLLFLVPFTISIVVRLFAFQQLLAARGPMRRQCSPTCASFPRYSSRSARTRSC